jgi:hypothetical protein
MKNDLSMGGGSRKFYNSILEWVKPSVNNRQA